MDELEKLAKEAWRPPEADTQRLKVDLKIVPHTLYSDPHFFVANTRSCGGKFYRDLFNTLYREERFCEEDFRVYRRKLEGGKYILWIALPDSGAAEWCSAYVIACEEDGEGVERVQFFTVEETMYGWRRFGAVDSEGHHTNFGKPTGNIKEDVEVIIQKAFGE